MHSVSVHAYTVRAEQERARQRATPASPRRNAASITARACGELCLRLPLLVRHRHQRGPTATQRRQRRRERRHQRRRRPDARCAHTGTEAPTLARRTTTAARPTMHVLESEHAVTFSVDTAPGRPRHTGRGDPQQRVVARTARACAPPSAVPWAPAPKRLPASGPPQSSSRGGDWEWKAKVTGDSDTEGWEDLIESNRSHVPLVRPAQARPSFTTTSAAISIRTLQNRSY